MYLQQQFNKPKQLQCNIVIHDTINALGILLVGRYKIFHLITVQICVYQTLEWYVQTFITFHLHTYKLQRLNIHTRKMPYKVHIYTNYLISACLVWQNGQWSFTHRKHQCLFIKAQHRETFRTTSKKRPLQITCLKKSPQ